MLDLASLTDDLIRTEFIKFVSEDNGQDKATVCAVGAADRERAEREQQLLKWLNWMKVIRFFPKSTREKIAGRILAYADERRPSGPLGSASAILSEYENLSGRIQEVIGPGQKSGKPRGVTSLTSKALWCCYPNDVPIFDANAERALQVISRLCRITPNQSGTPYALFVEVWLQLYAKLKPVIEQADLKGYPYRIRVLDILLWRLGSPGFEKSAVNVPRTVPE